ncbi:hypothetical protein GQ600_8793 [Phytophthora cactorum]|nr:hypothetical protein GQ600_8793 [Phytophthora cactorum]
MRRHSEAGFGSLKKDAVLQFMRENTTVPPIQHDLHAADDFEKFLMSLTARNGGKSGQPVYDSMRLSLHRGYGRSMSMEFAADLTVFFKGLKRTVARQTTTVVRSLQRERTLFLSRYYARCVNL